MNKSIKLSQKISTVRIDTAVQINLSGTPILGSRVCLNATLVYANDISMTR